MTLKLPKIVKLKLPFFSSSKGSGEEAAFQPDFDPAQDFESDEDRKPRGFRKWLPWGGVALAYLGVAAVAGGTVYYLSTHADDIQSEMMALRPKLVVQPLPGGPPVPAGDAGQEMAGDAHASSTDQGGDSHGEGDNHQEMASQETAPPTPELQPDSNQILQPQPDPNLVEETPLGPLPKIAADGRQPWRVYARMFNSLDKRPKVAIVVTDLGLNQALSEEAIGLPGAMTLGFASYAGGLSDWIDKARTGGHEVLLTLPMEPYDYPRSDPGPYALMTSYDAAENMKKLNWVLTRATGYVGLINFEGTRFSGNVELLTPVLTQLAARGLLYVDNGAAPLSMTRDVARDTDAPAVVADLVLDNPPDRASIVGQLARLETIARAKGVAVGVVHPFPASLNRLRVWSRELAAKGIALIPVSGVVAGGYRKNAQGSG